ncbi:MAG: hypothetical protein IJY84_01965 [Clostridia bacterium]|nr:hypothetical protein [Clostridia bacterium]
MFFFKKKTNAEKNKNDRDMIEANSKMMEALIVLTDNADLKAEFKAIEEQIKYIIPLVDDKAAEMDKKIKNAISDIKIELVKDRADDKATAKLNGLVKDLKVLIAERKALV